MKFDVKPRSMRRLFVRQLVAGICVVWPILSGLLVAIVVLGLAIGVIEGWSVEESIYFAFVTGLTIGYGDLVPKVLSARVMAILIGACGILLTAVLAAIAVKALTGVEKAQGTVESTVQHRSEKEGAD